MLLSTFTLQGTMLNDVEYTKGKPTFSKHLPEARRQFKLYILVLTFPQSPWELVYVTPI